MKNKPKITRKMIARMSWDDFRKTGLLLFVNSFLQIFGLSIVLVIRDDDGTAVDAFPARNRFRGFDEKDTTEAYQKLNKYIKRNAKRFCKD